MKCDDDNESITINTLILFSFILSHKLLCYYRMYLSSATKHEKRGKKNSRKDKRTTSERDMRKAGFEYKLTFYCEDSSCLYEFVSKSALFGQIRENFRRRAH